MDRTLNKISTRYALHLTAKEFKCILFRDAERLLNYKPTLSDLLEQTYYIEHVVINDYMICYSISHQDNEAHHNLIHNDIEMYIEGLETEWTGVDSRIEP
jgi:hypothetical protein